MLTLFIVYSICGATWGLVLSLIGLQEGGFFNKELSKYPAQLRSKMLPLMLVGAVLFEAVAWPIDVPLMLYKMFIKKTERR